MDEKIRADAESVDEALEEFPVLFRDRLAKDLDRPIRLRPLEGRRADPIAPGALGAAEPQPILEELALAARTLTNEARATAADDPDPANNVDSVTTTIG